MKDNNRIEKLFAAAAAIGVWQIIAMLIDNSLLIATPLVVASKLLHLGFSLEFWTVLSFSFFRIVMGFLIGLVIGILFAVIAGRFHFAEIMFYPYMVAVKSIPVASFIILCLIWLNSKSLSIFIAFLMVLPIIYTNVLQGIKNTDEKLLEMAYLFRMRWWRKVYYIYLPQLKPYLVSASSVAIGLSWKAGIAAEVIGIPAGSIGEKLYEAKVYFSSADLFAWTVAIVVVSILFEKMFTHGIKLLFIGRVKI